MLRTCLATCLGEFRSVQSVNPQLNASLAEMRAQHEQLKAAEVCANPAGRIDEIHCVDISYDCSGISAIASLAASVFYIGQTESELLLPLCRLIACRGDWGRPQRSLGGRKGWWKKIGRGHKSGRRKGSMQDKSTQIPDEPPTEILDKVPIY